MAQAVDFFVSYTSADRAWAEWIAWQLQVRVPGSSSKRGTLTPSNDCVQAAGGVRDPCGWDPSPAPTS
jgi:hypothetical protein